MIMRIKMIKYAQALVFIILLLAFTGCVRDCDSESSSYDDSDSANDIWQNVYIQLDEKVTDVKQVVLDMIDDSWTKTEPDESGSQLYIKRNNFIHGYGKYDMTYILPKDINEMFLVDYYYGEDYDNADSRIVATMVMFFDTDANAKEYYNAYINGCETNDPQQFINVYLCGKSVIVFNPLSTEHTSENKSRLDVMLSSFCQLLKIDIDTP